MRTSSLLPVLLILLVSIFQLVAYESRAEPEQNATQAPKKARISLESKHLDIDDIEKYPSSTPTGSIVNDYELQPERWNVTSANSRNQHVSKQISATRRKSKKRGRADRQSSNIWSMFLPDNTDAEYEDTVDSNGESESTQALDSGESPGDFGVQRLEPAERKSPSNETLDNNLRDKHDERLIAKYSKPFAGQDSSSNEFMLTSSSGSQNRISGLTNQSQSDEEPVQLISGALSKDSNGITPTMNEIESNIMNSMSVVANEPNSTDLARPISMLSETEKEDESLDKPSENSNKTKTDTEFERWLSRIQLRDSSSNQTTTEMPGKKVIIIKPTKKPNQLKQSIGEIDPIGASSSTPRPSKNATRLRFVSTTTTSTEGPSRLQQTRQAPDNQSVKGHQRKWHSSVSQRAGLQPNGAVKTSGLAQDEWAVPAGGRFQQHPFQQQLRQQQAQLIHGIKHPAAQASTISVSTQDGASNTSLSFAMVGSLGGPSSELSQVVNSTVQPSGPETETSAVQAAGNEQASYQSQDEILRQVTSAINFEQQLNQKRRDKANLLASDQGDSSSEANPMARLFKVGTSLSDIVDGASSTTSSPLGSSQLTLPIDLQKNSTGSRVQLGDGFDLLAEKLRNLAQQQQLANSNSSQPLWLTRATNASLLTKNGSGQAQITAANLEQLREIFNKHERNKQELKSSQEMMAQMMKQLILMNGNKGEPNFENLLSKPPASGDTENQIDEQGHTTADGEGWMPLNAPTSGASSGTFKSPAALVKSRTKSQSKVDLSSHSSSEPAFNNLASAMLTHRPAPLEQSLLSHEYHESSGGEPGAKPGQLIGLPIAVMDDGEIELSQAQLEQAAVAAAEQYVAHKRHLNRSPSDLDQSHLAQVQRLLKSQSPQSFAPSHGLSPRTPPRSTTEVGVSSSAAGGAIEQVSNLLSDDAAGRLKQAPSSNSDQQQAPRAQRPGGGAQTQSNMEQQQQNLLNLHRQHLQQQRLQTPSGTPQLYTQPLQYRAPPSSSQFPGASLQQNSRPLVTTTMISSGGPPVKVREMSLYRPFGFQSHHALAYQASPVVAAMFPGLSQAPRPSLFRHMSPFRAAASDERLLAPLFASGGANMHAGYLPTTATTTIEHHYPPMAAFRPQLYRSDRQVKRQVPVLAGASTNAVHPSWHPKIASAYASTGGKVRLRHLEPEEESFMDINDDDLSEFKFATEEIFTLPRVNFDSQTREQPAAILNPADRKSARNVRGQSSTRIEPTELKGKLMRIEQPSFSFQAGQALNCRPIGEQKVRSNLHSTESHLIHHQESRTTTTLRPSRMTTVSNHESSTFNGNVTISNSNNNTTSPSTELSGFVTNSTINS